MINLCEIIYPHGSLNTKVQSSKRCERKKVRE